MDAMQLPNFQPLALNEDDVPELDLGGAEPLPPVSDHDLASLVRSVGMTSITDIDRLVGELQKKRLPTIRREAGPSRDGPLYHPYRGRFGLGKDHL